MKRLFDVIISILLLTFLAPIFLYICILVRVKLGSPVFFIQERPGLEGKPFKIIKFRTMIDEFDELGYKLSDEKRLTNFGRKLRKTSLDEIPELWNVLKGDMSLVGPRPLRMGYLTLYNSHQARRHEVRPGITGWAQVNGRNSISWNHKFNLDVWYVENKNIWLDIKILFQTVKKVIFTDGISANNHSTMPEFKGSNDE